MIGKEYIYQCGYSRAYIVKKEKENLYGIYFYDFGMEKHITHKTNQKQAEKLAKLLAKAYKTGYKDGKELYEEERF